MNITDLPDDILILIFLNLNCDEITIAHKILKRFNLEYLLNLRKNKGYPRLNGHCIIHHIPKSVIQANYDGETPDVSNDSDDSYDYNADHNLDHPDPYSDEYKNITILNYFLNENIEIVKGDIVIYNNHNNAENGFLLYRVTDDMSKFNNKYYEHQARIFDGRKLIKLDHYEFKNLGNRQYLPKDFNVIENNVPINYWSNSDHSFINEHKIIRNKYYEAKYYKNPFDFDIVRLNIKLVIDQCINNIKFKCKPFKYIYMYTTFSIHNITYRIVYYKYNFNIKYLEVTLYDEKSFKKTLLNDETLFTVSHKKNTLNVRL